MTVILLNEGPGRGSLAGIVSVESPAVIASGFWAAQPDLTLGLKYVFMGKRDLSLFCLA